MDITITRVGNLFTIVMLLRCYMEHGFLDAARGARDLINMGMPTRFLGVPKDIARRIMENDTYSYRLEYQQGDLILAEVARTATVTTNTNTVST